MTRLASSATQTAGMARSEAFIRAGEQWLLADDPAHAVEDFRRALAEGGPSSVDPRVPLARALFMLGRAGEAGALIREMEREPPTDPRMCDMLAELLVELSELPAAFAWATAGIQLCLGQTPGPVAPGPGTAGGGPGSRPRSDAAGTQMPPSAAADQTELRLLLSLRFRVRNDLGLPEDEYDRMLDDLPLPNA